MVWDDRRNRYADNYFTVGNNSYRLEQRGKSIELIIFFFGGFLTHI